MNERPGKKYIGVWLPEAVHAALAYLARADDRSMNYIVARMLERGVEHLSKSGKKAPREPGNA